MSSDPIDQNLNPDREVLFKMVHRHAHDIRNCFGGLDLEATLIGELSGDPEVEASVDRIKSHLKMMDGYVKTLLMMFDSPRPVVVTAGDLLQLWRLKLGNYQSSNQIIEWPAGHELMPISVDTRAVVHVLCNLTLAAWQRAPGSPLLATLEVAEGNLVLGLTEGFPGNPLPQHILCEAEGLIGRQGGDFKHQQDPVTGGWLTRISLPGAGQKEGS